LGTELLSDPLKFKRLTDLAVPSAALFVRGQPCPAHILDLVLQLFGNWKKPEDLTFYAPELESEEDAEYLKLVIEKAEAALRAVHPEYAAGTVRVVVVHQNPRAMFRAEDIKQALHPHYAGAALDWDRYVAGSIFQFKEDATYVVPPTASPEEANVLLRFLHDGGDVRDAKVQKQLMLLDLVHSESSNDISGYQSMISDSLQFLAAQFSGAEAPGPLCNFSGLERARWQVWHAVHHKKISMDDFLSSALHHFNVFRKEKNVAEKWLFPALYVLALLMGSEKAVESVQELLLTFTVDSVVSAADPWGTVQAIAVSKYDLAPFVQNYCIYFNIFASSSFAGALARHLVLDMGVAEQLFNAFSDSEIADINAKRVTPIETSNLRVALWSSVSSELRSTNMYAIGESLRAALAKHGVTGATISVSSSEGNFQAVPVGDAIKGVAPVTAHTRFEVASLSKTICSCFAIEYFEKLKIPLSTPANELLAKYSSPFRIPSGDPSHPEWGDEVTLAQLMDHSSLNMHYVNGIPLTDPMPDVLDLIAGNLDKKYGYVAACAAKPPGVTFGYSGGGFLVLQHLIEKIEGKDIVEITDPFIKRMGMTDFTFENKTQPGYDYASGYRESGEMVSEGRRMHPAFPAGGMGTALDLTVLLTHLTSAFNASARDCPISHDTAVQMFDCIDKGSQKFMGASMGLGVFVAEAGANKLAIHQGANDGFRCLFVHCFAGLDRGKGFVVHCNAELNGVFFIAEVAQILFHELRMQGVDETKFKKDFKVGDIPSEQIVNMGYKELIFAALEPDVAERILITGPPDPWAKYNLAVGGVVKEVSNERFALAENLLSPLLPTFEPKLFGRQGKVMDSWETVRHNPKPYDTLIFDLKSPAKIHFTAVSTKFHTGNHAPGVAIDGRAAGDAEWTVIIPRTHLEGHSQILQTTVNDENKIFTEIRVLSIPDGGITRLGLYNKETISPELHSLFSPPGVARNVKFTDPVPGTVKPLSPEFHASAADIQASWDSIPTGWEVDLASAAVGGQVYSATDEHYGPASHILSPYPPLSMFDGMENARSRVAGHSEEVVVKLARQSILTRIEMDMTYFVNNNPRDVEIFGCCNDLDEWTTLVSRRRVKGYRGNFVEYSIDSSSEFTHIKVVTHPCGGLNRLKVFGKKI
ncbi:unnamed protein product, partial [Ectocarpus fasciculatus]